MADPSPGVNILNLPPALAAEVIDGLIELANHSGSCRGYSVVLSSSENYLEDRKYPDDRALVDYSIASLKTIAECVKGT